ncbi:MAG: hypothetical protein Q8P16_02080 [bacterium]|nr:hypothetical protein [bacterium]
MAKKKTTKMSRNRKIGIGVSAAAAVAAAAAAGYYFYMSKDAKKHRTQVAKWASDMKKDVVAQARKLKKLSKKDVDLIIARAAAAYQRARNVDKEKIKQAAQELKDNWDMLEKEIRKGAKAGVAKGKKAVSKAAKKTKKSAAKKPTAKKK